MRFVARHGASTREVQALLHDPDATLADLLASLAPEAPPGTTLRADGVPIPLSRRADRAGIRDGSTVQVVEPEDGRVDDPARTPTDQAGAPPSMSPAAVFELSVVGGLDAGGRRFLAVGRHHVGRDDVGRDGGAVAVTDPSVSSRHAELVVDGARVTVSDSGSRNGTWIDDRAVTQPVGIGSQAIVRMGATQLRVAPVLDAGSIVASAVAAVRGSAASTGGASTVAFNRPPRTIKVTEHEPLDPPEPPAAPPGVGAVGIVAVVAPLLMAVVMVKVLGNLMFGLFALLSPILLIGGSVESRRRGRRARRREQVRFRRDLDRFASGLPVLVAAEHGRRRQRLPDPAETVRRAEAASTTLWERRPGHDDFLALRAGTGPVPWTPTCRGDVQVQPEEVRRLIDRASILAGAPVELDLANGGVVGVVGPRSAALAVARSLVVQAAVHHGPSDVAVAVLTSEARVDDWTWAGWLPHTADADDPGRRLLAAGTDPCDELLRALLERQAGFTRAVTGTGDGGQPGGGSAGGPTVVLVLDDEDLTRGRRSPARSLLRNSHHAVAGVIVAEGEDHLPSFCSVVVELTDDLGSAEIRWPRTGATVAPALAAGLSVATARRAARALAGFDDPELGRPGAGLPSTVGLLPLLGLDPPEPEELARRWRAAGADPRLIASLGIGDDGVLAVDLVRDGPHALVAGTTGAGKSELLRTLVAGLAASSPPDLLTFVLIDFKGGSAFDACAELPHTVGLVTDLDEHLGARALRCLEAELRRRERLLRAAGATDLSAYRSQPGPPVGQRETIPRLVVVIDEFATLAAELPDFVDALVNIAQRGRSLGVHLVLATQRPTGAVSDHIRANTNLRVALRVQDEADSLDVVDVRDAASLSRTQPGRALVRLGPGEVLAMQTALVTARSRPEGRPAIEVVPLRFGGQTGVRQAGPVDPDESSSNGHRAAPATDLHRLAHAVSVAFRASGRPPPRQPWPAPLPRNVDLADVLPEGPSPARLDDPGTVVPFVLVDDPDHQRQHPGGWSPADGNLLLTGITGSGTTTAIGSLALAIAATTSPDVVHLYVLDFGAGELGPLVDLPHVGAVIAADERERQARLVRHLQDELVHRRAITSRERKDLPRLVVLIDGLAGFRAAWPDTGPTPLLDDLVRVLADGPELGVLAVLSAERAGTVPAALAALTAQKLVFRLGDPAEYAAFGLGRSDVPTFVPGTAVWSGSGQEVQVAHPSNGVPAAVRQLASEPGPARPPGTIGTLPALVEPADLASAVRMADDAWTLPLGISERDLRPAGFCLFPGDHALIAGPSRSGRTSALCALAVVLHHAAPSATVVAVTDPHRSALGRLATVDLQVAPDGLGAHVAELLAASERRGVLILVDDAERIDDADGALSTLLDSHRHHLHVVAAGLADPLRSAYAHWTRQVRISRTGLLLHADPDLDGDLLGTRLARHAPVALRPGRGWLVQGGHSQFIQSASVY